ncbi:MAG: hypothetical protein E6H06_04105 [Bacteroidetes bacterium]|nr:MAG: hypothetical protein E6H06_04105 [Bacteroidota bacterium]
MADKTLPLSSATISIATFAFSLNSSSKLWLAILKTLVPKFLGPVPNPLPGPFPPPFPPPLPPPVPGPFPTPLPVPLYPLLS